jgi:hypothetical protein
MVALRLNLLCIVVMKAACSIGRSVWQTAFPISSFGVDKGHCNMFTTLQNELFSYSVVVWWLYGRLFLSSIDLVHFVLVYLRGVSGLGCKIARCSLFFEPVVREKCKIF